MYPFFVTCHLCTTTTGAQQAKERNNNTHTQEEVGACGGRALERNIAARHSGYLCAPETGFSGRIDLNFELFFVLISEKGGGETLAPNTYQAGSQANAHNYTHA